MIYVTSDLHGFSHRDFLALLDGAGFSPADTLYVLGDVIDRNGDGGVETLRWLRRQSNARLLMGNHEQMLCSCAFLFAEVTEELADGLTGDMLTSALIWSQNGSAPTIESLAFLRRTNPGEFAALMEYVREAPLYRRVSTPGGDFLLTHAGLGDFDPEKPLEAYDPHDLLWHRPKPSDRYFEDVTAVFGHTPTGYYGVRGGRMKRTDTWIDIDTGAAGGGAPMLLRLDDLREFYWS